MDSILNVSKFRSILLLCPEVEDSFSFIVVDWLLFVFFFPSNCLPMALHQFFSDETFKTPLNW